MQRLIGRMRFAGSVAALIAAVPLAGEAIAQDYPNERITFIVGFAAGGYADGVSRIVAEHIGSVLGQTVIVENRGGAASNIAARAVASAEPDGYTVLATTTSVAINATLFKTIDYSLLEDLRPVAIAVSAPETLNANPSRPGTLAEFLEASKTQDLTYGSAGVGSGSYFTWWSFFEAADADIAHVPFQGGGPATQAAIGGQVDALAATASGNTVSNVATGQLVCLAVAAPERDSRMPDCPTLEEQGYANHYGSSWVGFFVPAGTPDDVVQTLNEAINSIADDAAKAENLTRNGALSGLNVEETEAFVRSEVETWGARVIESGAQVE